MLVFTALPSAGHLETVHSRPLSSLQIEVPAEAIASHQKAQTRYTVSWKLLGTSQAQKSTCSLFEITSTGAALSFLSRIPNNSLLYPPESRP